MRRERQIVSLFLSLSIEEMLNSISMQIPQFRFREIPYPLFDNVRPETAVNNRSHSALIGRE